MLNIFANNMHRGRKHKTRICVGVLYKSTWNDLDVVYSKTRRMDEINF